MNYEHYNRLYQKRKRQARKGLYMKTIFDTPHPVRYISHRGFMPLAPENSLAGFEYAGLLSQWAIETDVYSLDFCG